MKRLLLCAMIACLSCIAGEKSNVADKPEQDSVFPEKKLLTFKDFKKESKSKKFIPEQLLGRFLEVSSKTEELKNTFAGSGGYYIVRFNEGLWIFEFWFTSKERYNEFRNATKPAKLGGYICRAANHTIWFTDEPKLYKMLYRDDRKVVDKNFER